MTIERRNYGKSSNKAYGESRDGRVKCPRIEDRSSESECGSNGRPTHRGAALPSTEPRGLDCRADRPRKPTDPPPSLSLSPSHPFLPLFLYLSLTLSYAFTHLPAIHPFPPSTNEQGYPHPTATPSRKQWQHWQLGCSFVPPDRNARPPSSVYSPTPISTLLPLLYLFSSPASPAFFPLSSLSSLYVFTRSSFPRRPSS